MQLENQRKLVADYGRKLITSGLTTGTGGNISVLDRETGLFAISPSGMDYFEIEPEDVTVLDLNGKIIDGVRKPSSELKMHLMIYNAFKGAAAVVHCHSTYAAALSILRMDLPASSYIIGDAGGDSVRCAEYAVFGSKKIAQNTVKAMEGRRACLNANHGQTVYGKDIQSAFSLALNIEQLSKIHIIAMSAGKPVILSKPEMDEVLEKFSGYGQ